MFMIRYDTQRHVCHVTFFYIFCSYLSAGHVQTFTIYLHYITPVLSHNALLDLIFRPSLFSPLGEIPPCATTEQVV